MMYDKLNMPIVIIYQSLKQLKNPLLFYDIKPQQQEAITKCLCHSCFAEKGFILHKITTQSNDRSSSIIYVPLRVRIKAK